MKRTRAETSRQACRFLRIPRSRCWQDVLTPGVIQVEGAGPGGCMVQVASDEDNLSKAPTVGHEQVRQPRAPSHRRQISPESKLPG